MWGFCLPCSSPRKYDLQWEQHCYTFKAGGPCSQQLVLVKYECCVHILCGASRQPAALTHAAGIGGKGGGRRVARDCCAHPWPTPAFTKPSTFSPQALRVAWSFGKEMLGLIWLHWLCVLGINALVFTDWGVGATVSAPYWWLHICPWRHRVSPLVVFYIRRHKG